ncbi:MAG: RHS repeat-associated core domain-containing protein, partial [bacterium]
IYNSSDCLVSVENQGECNTPNSVSQTKNEEPRTKNQEPMTKNVSFYSYNHQGMRTKKITTDKAKEYIYDKQAVLIERFFERLVNEMSTNASQKDPQFVKYNYGSESLISLNQTSKPTQYYLNNAFGSTTTELVGETGVILVVYVYDPWGNFRGNFDKQAVASDYTFTGKELDEETGLFYFGVRYYDSKRGMFVTQDSYLGEVGEPPSLNRYVYCWGRPTGFVDPFGNNSILVLGKEMLSAKESSALWAELGVATEYIAASTVGVGTFLGLAAWHLADPPIANNNEDQEYKEFCQTAFENHLEQVKESFYTQLFAMAEEEGKNQKKRTSSNSGSPEKPGKKKKGKKKQVMTPKLIEVIKKIITNNSSGNLLNPMEIARKYRAEAPDGEKLIPLVRLAQMIRDNADKLPFIQKGIDPSSTVAYKVKEFFKNEGITPDNIKNRFTNVTHLLETLIKEGILKRNGKGNSIANLTVILWRLKDEGGKSYYIPKFPSSSGTKTRLPGRSGRTKSPLSTLGADDQIECTERIKNRKKRPKFDN